jgi:hypothetical protein
MSNPQQPELARSRKTPAQDPDSAAAVIEGQSQPGADAPRGPVPPENQPGHHPAEEQDKPDLDAFAARLGVSEAPGGAAPGYSGEAVVGERSSRFGGAVPRIAAVVAALAALVSVLMITKQRRRGKAS